LRSVAIVIVLACSTAVAVWAETPAPNGKAAAKKSTAKKSTKSTAKSSKSAPKKAASGKQSVSTKQASSKKTSGKHTPAKSASSSYRRSTQREPAPERYKEVQQSLADKGYFSGPVNGTWSSDSVEALKRFQRDQNIGDDGKLGSLSLIALGLGPKRGASSAENPGAGLPPP
jgi:peptidoglycan hydrolase-like protein with peptidoglycan-binding domain